MRKKDESLKSTLLMHARDLATTQGTGAINIRSLASKAGVATGTVYNYFSSKEEILLALTEEYWQNTLDEMQDCVLQGAFPDQLVQIYAFLNAKISDSAGMLMSSLSGAELNGRQRMTVMQRQLGNILEKCLGEDESIGQDVWTESFTVREYANFILVNLLSQLRMQGDIHFLLEIVRRTLYQ